MSISIEDLNANQRHALEWNKGPLLVLAGPGSGKTAVLTLRIANLIANTLSDRFRILGLTFTVKAANEMQNRIRNVLGEDSKRIQLRTFHSFCTDILGQHGSQLGLRPDFEVITDERDRIAILQDLKYSGQLEIEDLDGCLKQIDTMLMYGLVANDLPKYFKDGQEYRCRALQDAFRGYMRRLIVENQLDFGSMLHFTRELLETRPRIARQVRTVYQYVCVDEFQDTNLAQYQVLRLICPERDSNLFVVADDDQIIFQWNGADPKRLEQLRQDYSPEIVQLPENFRCPPEVVTIANELIAHNPRRINSKKHGVAHRSKYGVIQVKSFRDYDEEVKGLITKIEPISRNQRESCLVIARSNKLLLHAKDMMIETGMNAEIVSKHQDFASPPIQVMYYSIKLANATESRSVLNKLCSAASLFDGNTISAEEVSATARVEGLSLLRAFFLLSANRPRLERLASNGIALLCDALNYSQFAQETIQDFDTFIQLDNGEEEFPDYCDDKANWTRISNQIHRTHGKRISVHVFLQMMDLSPKSKILSKDCVRLQTVHTAKGTEFDNVFVIGLAEEQFPTYFAIKNGDSAICEERRNCFVAITRSSRNLYLSYATKYFGWNKQPSRFLREMGLINAKEQAI